MSQDIVNSLKLLFDNIGQYVSGNKEDIKNSYDKMMSLLGQALPEGFVPKKQNGGIYRRNPSSKTRSEHPQFIKDYFWIRGEDQHIKNPIVSYSLFLDKKDDQPRLRVSVEIKNKSSTLEERSTYENMLELPLISGLSYFYSGNVHNQVDQSVIEQFVRDRKAEDHVEVVKMIDLNNTTDDKLIADTKEAIEDLKPFYEKATTYVDSPKPVPSPSPKGGAATNGGMTIMNVPESFEFSKNIILFGPPGTGKTYHSVAYAEAIVQKKQDILDKLKKGETVSDYSELKIAFDHDLVQRDKEGKVTGGHICFTTFHQSYSYEDFIEGIFPDVENGNLGYKLKSGVFKSLCDYAKDKESENFVIIIDEINRGNISKIFGDLISFVEEDKRIGEKNELRAALPYSKETWGVPKNVYIIGTMNTADRSIERIDTALRRRFRFFEIMPNPQLLDKYKTIEDNEGNQTDLSLSELLTSMNDRIAYVFDREHQIGHSYFLKIQVDSKGIYHLSDLADVFQREIIPLLQEYFYNNYRKIRYVLGESSFDADASDDIIVEKERSDYASYGFDDIDDGDDEEKVYEINHVGFENIENYMKILNKETVS